MVYTHLRGEPFSGGAQANPCGPKCRIPRWSKSEETDGGLTALRMWDECDERTVEKNSNFFQVSE